MTVANFKSLLVFTLYFVSYYRAADNAVTNATTLTECDREQEWTCDNGQCIPGIVLCDGQAHCDDNSDETVENCIHFPCPLYAFRCAYGACIAGSYRCDGRRDCLDNSDETEFLCYHNTFEINRKLQGNCSSSALFQCKSGECIEKEQHCDGIADCPDGSDETVHVCSHIYCPLYAFQCGYGGCIRGNAKCDGVKDCYDGSDEVAQLCGRERKRPMGLTTTRRPTTTTTGTTVVSNTIGKPHEGCLIPLNREKLIVIDDGFMDGEILRLGARVPVLAAVKFSCPQPWQLEGMEGNICMRTDSWLYDLPYCRKYCPLTTLTLGISTLATCSHNDMPLNCSERLPAGTKANISCAPGYRLPTRNVVQRVLTCDRDMEWDFPKFKCSPKCGVLPKKNANTTKPWDVSIYKRTFDAAFQRKCAGTILSPKIVVSAAICFADPIDESDYLYYNVVEGNCCNEYRQGTLGSRVHNISEILLSSTSQDVDLYMSHLAVLVLVDYFKLSVNLRPICLESQLAPNGELQMYVTSPDHFFRAQAQVGSGAELQNRQGNTFLFGVVNTNYSNGTVVILNTNYFKRFINTIIKRYYYLL